MRLWLRLRDRLGPGHLVDDVILQLLIPSASDTPSPAARTHLDQCSRCTKRSAKLRAFLNSLTEANEATLAGIFPVDRVTTQRTRIMRRLRRSVEPARPTRILSFPTRAHSALSGLHRVRYWLGGAVAAGFLVGIGVGQLFHEHPQPTNGTSGMSTEAVVSASRQPSTASFTDPGLEYDDPFLDELELMLNSPQVLGLTPLDEITPRVREISVNVW